MKSEPNRILAGKLNKKIIDSILISNPKAKIISMGDFNDNPDDKSIKPILNTVFKKTEIKSGQLYNPMEELFKKGDHWYSEWHRLYFRKMMVEQVSELLNEKNAELILSLAEKYQPNNLGVVERQDEEIGAVAQDRGRSVNNNNNNLEYIS